MQQEQTNDRRGGAEGVVEDAAGVKGQTAVRATTAMSQVAPEPEKEPLDPPRSGLSYRALHGL